VWGVSLADPVVLMLKRELGILRILRRRGDVAAKGWSRGEGFGVGRGDHKREGFLGILKW